MYRPLPGAGGSSTPGAPDPAIAARTALLGAAADFAGERSALIYQGGPNPVLEWLIDLPGGPTMTFAEIGLENSAVLKIGGPNATQAVAGSFDPVGQLIDQLDQGLEGVTATIELAYNTTYVCRLTPDATHGFFIAAGPVQEVLGIPLADKRVSSLDDRALATAQLVAKIDAEVADTSYSALPLRAGETATNRISRKLPFPGGDVQATFWSAGLARPASLEMTVGGDPVSVAVSPSMTFNEFSGSLQSAFPGSVGINGFVDGLEISLSAGADIAIVPNAASEFFGLAEIDSRTWKLPKFWQGGEIVQVPGDYPTIAEALAAVRTRRAPPGNGVVTVSLAAGTHNLDSSLTVGTNENLGYIKLAGAGRDLYNEAGGLIAASVAGQSVTYTVSSAFAAACNVGDVVIAAFVTAPTTSDVAQHAGAFEVTGKTATTITVKNTSVAAKASGNVPVSLIRHRSQIRTNMSGRLLEAIGGVGPWLDRISFRDIRGAGDCDLISLEQGGRWNAVAARPQDGGVLEYSIGAVGYRYGVICNDPGSSLTGTFAFGALASRAFLATDGGKIRHSGVLVNGCGSDGLICYDDGTIVGSTESYRDYPSVIAGCVGKGINGFNRGETIHRYGAVFGNAGGNDLLANVASTNIIGTSSQFYFGTASPALGVSGNTQSLNSRM